MSKAAGREDREAELQKLNRTLQAHTRSVRAMIRATSEADYLQEVCRIVVEDCAHAMVWVGFAEEDAAKTIRPVAYAGFEKGYLDTLNLTWADTERGQGPTGTAIRTGKPCSCRNMLADPNFAPWREEALKRGYASSLVLPLTDGGKAFGAITIYENKPDAFSQEETDLLSHLADDLALGIASLRLREAHARMEEELRSLALFPDESPGPVIRISEGGTILYANKAANAILACWERRAGEPAPEPVLQIIGHALDSGLSRELEIECGDRVFSLVFAPIRDRGYVTIYGSDVTDRKRLEEEVLRSRDELEVRVMERTREVAESNHRLRESRRTIQRIADTTPDIVYIYDFAGRQVTYANLRAAEFMGRTLAEVGKPGFDLQEERIHPDDRARVQSARERFATADESDIIECECRAQRADGQWRWLLVRETLFARGLGARPKQILGTALDITDRKESEERLRESERKFRAIFDQVFQFIGLLKPDGTVLEVNEPALSFARVSFQDVRGRPLWEGGWWRAMPAARKQLKEAVVAAAAGRFVRYETKLRGEGDSVIIADFSVKPVFDPAGEPVFLIVEARDISERKRLEQEILSAASAERRRIGLDLHDGLGQQLASVALLSRALQQRVAASDVGAAEEARVIMELANQAVSHTRVIARGLCPVDLTEDGLVNALQGLAADTERIFGIPCEFRCDTPAPVADSALAAHLFYIAQEAVSNAVKHSGAGTITVSLSGGSDGISVRVRDDGVGLPKQPEKTHGLGFRTMRYRADAIGAFLDIRSVPPRGTIVRCFVRTPQAEAT
jgi:PAS domain S-box-containing protein